MQLHTLIILYIVSRTLQVSVKRMCLHRVLVNFRYVIFPLIIITKVNFGDNKRTTQKTSVMRLQLYISSLSHIIYHFWHITMMNLFNTWFYLSVLIFGRSQLPRQNKVFISTFKYGLYSLKEKKISKVVFKYITCSYAKFQLTEKLVNRCDQSIVVSSWLLDECQIERLSVTRHIVYIMVLIHLKGHQLINERTKSKTNWSTKSMFIFNNKIWYISRIIDIYRSLEL